MNPHGPSLTNQVKSNWTVNSKNPPSKIKGVSNVILAANYRASSEPKALEMSLVESRGNDSK